MPTITLDNGTKVHISQESYDALAKAMQPKELTYKKVAKKLFKEGATYVIDTWGEVQKWEDVGDKYVDANNAVSENQCKQLLALNKLFNVAYFLNEGWVPDWSDTKQKKYMIVRNGEMNTIEVVFDTFMYRVGGVYFKSEELAKRAIAILGEKSIKECFGIFE